MREMWVQSLGWEDPLEEDMATHSSIPAWEIPWTEDDNGRWVSDVNNDGKGGSKARLISVDFS